MNNEVHKVILPKFDNYDELIKWVDEELAIYHYQSGDFDKIEESEDSRLVLKEPPTFEEFMCYLKNNFPHGVRVGSKYLDKYGRKINKDDE